MEKRLDDLRMAMVKSLTNLAMEGEQIKSTRELLFWLIKIRGKGELGMEQYYSARIQFQRESK